MPKDNAASGYATNVFINCPFDVEFEPLFHAMVFAVIQCGYTFRCSLEADDTGTTRIDRIYRLIDECRFGVHDISRIEHDTVNNLPRFNMPFELGLFLGARRFGTRPHRDKHCVVPEADRYRYQKYLSDIASQDIRQHDSDRAKAVGAVRDWLAASRSNSATPLPGATAIMRHCSEFQAHLPAMLRAADLEPAELGFFDRAKPHGAVSGNARGPGRIRHV